MSTCVLQDVEKPLSLSTLQICNVLFEHVFSKRLLDNRERLPLKQGLLRRRQVL